MTRVLVVTLLLTASALARAVDRPQTPNPHPYSQLYAFGDSYSDSGAGLAGADGPTAVVYLAERLGIPFTFYGDPRSSGKGLNFAVSGARTGSGTGRRYPTGEMLGYGMANQVKDFIAFSKSGDIPKFDPAQTVFFFAGGLNDRGTADGYTRTNIETEIETLYTIGARRFMVALLPTTIPDFATAGTQFNPELAKIPGEERAQHADIRIANSGWGTFFDAVMTHPAEYGITDTMNACAGLSIQHESTVPCPDPGTHFYYYAAHPSTAVHRVVGDMLYQEAITKAR